MQSQLQMKRFDVFPTSLVVFDWSSVFSEADVENMISDIDAIIEDGRHLQINERTPRWQCKPILFNPEITPGQHWQRLAQTFSQSCHLYTENVQDFCNNQNALEPGGLRAWFYKGYKSLNETQKNPWHNHSPSFLSGVFYLRVPGDHSVGGTEFRDGRGPGMRSIRDIVMLPYTLSWTIFPGWMDHRSSRVDTEDPRYVIAADCYIKVRA
jgi:hypothetical protein